MGLFDKRSPEEKAAAAQAKAEQQRIQWEVQQAEKQAQLNAMTIGVKLMHPTGSLPGGMLVRLSFGSSGLVIQDQQSDIAVMLPYSKIAHAQYYTEEQIVNEINVRKKYVVGTGRSIFGPIEELFGHTNPNRKAKVSKTTRWFFLVTYKPTSQEDSMIGFELGYYPPINDFAMELMKRAREQGGIQTVTTL